MNARTLFALMGPAEFPAYFRREVDKYAKLVKLSGARPE